MAQTLQITVDDVVLETKQGKNGEFQSLKIVGGGKTFRAYPDAISYTPQRGDIIEIAYNVVPLGKYSINQIVDLKKIGEGSPSAAKSAPWESTKPSSAQPPKQYTDNSAGMKRGNALTNAVNLALHNAALKKKPVELEEVEALAKNLLEISTRLENNV